MRLAESAAERLSPQHLVVASDALLARLRRIAQAATWPGVEPHVLARAAHDHRECAEALLGLIAVLREDDRSSAEVARLEGGLAVMLDVAKGWFPADS